LSAGFQPALRLVIALANVARGPYALSMTAADDGDDWVNVLVGQECDQIIFVRDYVQVGLESNRLSCVGRTSVVINDMTYVFPEAGSRDALCELINQHIVRAESREDGSLVLDFEDGVSLRVTRDPEHPEWEPFEVF
jgi:hypothetical protein